MYELKNGKIVLPWDSRNIKLRFLVSGDDILRSRMFRYSLDEKYANTLTSYDTELKQYPRSCRVLIRFCSQLYEKRREVVCPPTGTDIGRLASLVQILVVYRPSWEYCFQRCCPALYLQFSAGSPTGSNG